MNEIIAAIFSRLTTIIDDVSVYDHVPQDKETYPYIQMVQLNNVVDDTDTEKGFQITVRVLAFSRYRGMRELNTLTDRIYNALHQWEMPNTASYSVGFLIERSKQYNTAPDGLTRYSVQDYIMFVEPT